MSLFELHQISIAKLPAIVKLGDFSPFPLAFFDFSYLMGLLLVFIGELAAGAS